jgi:hypothetical protein
MMPIQQQQQQQGFPGMVQVQMQPNMQGMMGMNFGVQMPPGAMPMQVCCVCVHGCVYLNAMATTYSFHYPRVKGILFYITVSLVL